MHPINNKNFGPINGTIAVKYYNGISVVIGYIQKQIGSIRYKISDGNTTKIATLAQTNADLTALISGTGPNASNRANLCTIEITPYGGSTENIKKLTSAQAVTIQGSFITWKDNTNATSAGQGTISSVDLTPALKFNKLYNSQYIAVVL